MKVVCPNCQQPYDIADADIGKQFRCTKCQQTFVASTTQTSGSVTERAEQRVNDAISRLTKDDQSGVALARIYRKAMPLLTANETIEYIALQKRILFNLAPDALVITNRRVILLTIGLLGSTRMCDILTRDILDAKIELGVFRAKILIRTTNGGARLIENLLKTPAQRAYALLQEQEERSFEERRQRDLEQTRAEAGGISIGAGGLGSASHDDNFDQNVEKLEKLKKLLDSGLITQGEFESKRQAILSRL